MSFERWNKFVETEKSKHIRDTKKKQTWKDSRALEKAVPDKSYCDWKQSLLDYDIDV